MQQKDCLKSAYAGWHGRALSALLIVGVFALGFSCSEDQSDKIVLSFSSPAEGAHERARVLVQVKVTGSSTDTVELWQAQEKIADLKAPFKFMWDISQEPEGSTTLEARTVVDSATVRSEPLTVVIDRTAPSISAAVPSIDKPSDWLWSPVNYHASERLHSGFIRVSDLTITDGKGAPMDHSLTLVGNGATLLQRQYAPSYDVSMPFTFELKGFYDLAGNEGAPYKRTLTFPMWFETSLPADNDSNTQYLANGEEPPWSAVLHRQMPVVAWSSERPNSPHKTHVVQWEQGQWVALGGPFIENAKHPQLAVYRNEVWLGWLDGDTPDFAKRAHVAAFDKGNWHETPALPMSEGYRGFRNLTLGVVRGTLYAAWEAHSDTHLTDLRVFIAHWDGARWVLSAILNTSDLQVTGAYIRPKFFTYHKAGTSLLLNACDSNSKGKLSLFEVINGEWSSTGAAYTADHCFDVASASIWTRGGTYVLSFAGEKGVLLHMDGTGGRVVETPGIALTPQSWLSRNRENNVVLAIHPGTLPGSIMLYESEGSSPWTPYADLAPNVYKASMPMMSDEGHLGVVTLSDNDGVQFALHLLNR